jgi:alkaline phosphatase
VLPLFGLLMGLFSSSGTTEESPRNIIFMIGDGMGPAYTSAYRYYLHGKPQGTPKATVFDKLLVGNAWTYPDDDTWVTDSAAAATTLATGVKTFNGAVGVDANKAPLDSILKRAKRAGWRTGLVATSEIYHATPASFVAHSESRKEEFAIADDFVDAKVNGQLPVDLLLGGGRKQFTRDDRNLVAEMSAAGYTYVEELTQLSEVAQAQTVVGLFADSALPYALGSDTPLRLTHMTQAALANLGRNGAGFFLMVEGSLIDWCGHANDIACAMAEMADFAEAVKVAVAFVEQHPGTLLVVTADHSTGGLSLGRQGVYEWKPEEVKKIRARAETIARALGYAITMNKVWRQFVDFDLTLAQSFKLQAARLAALADGMILYEAVLEVLNERTRTGWTGMGHDATDVQVFATGQGADLFRGSLDNMDIGRRLMARVPEQAAPGVARAEAAEHD